jgi:surface protein
MKPTSIIQRLVILLVTLMSAIGANAAEAYACYTSSNTTLTFYYDNQRSSRTGKTYDLNSGFTDPLWLSSNVTKVVFNSSFSGARPTSTYSWFYNMTNLQSITGLSYLNTNMVTNMAWMFGYCSSLTSLDLSSFNTAKVTDMDYMFNGCTSLQTIYAGSGWITNTVSSSTAMFSDCTSLVGGKRTNYDKNHVDKTYAHIDGGSNNPGYFTAPNETMSYACYTPSNTTLTFFYDNQRRSRDNQGHTTYILNKGENTPGWGTDGIRSNVTKVVFDSSFAGTTPTSTYSWFYNMVNLQSITGMGFLNTSEVTNMAWMFAYSKKLTNLDLSSFNTSKVTTMEGMFSDCENLMILNLSSFNTSKVTDMRWMFIRCSKLQTIYVDSKWSAAAVTRSDYMFFNCSSLKGGKGTSYDASHVDATYARIDDKPSNPGYFTAGNEPYACYTSSNKTLTFYYDNKRSSRTNTHDLNTGSNDPGWLGISATKVEFDPSFADVRPTTTFSWFYGMTNLQTITGMSYLNTSEVTNMAWMFAYSKNLTNLNLSSFNTSKVTTMEGMFSDCENLMILNLSSFNTSKVTDMRWMFIRCSSLQTIYAGSAWSTAEVTNSFAMFLDCTSLVGGKGTTWNSSNPTDKTYARIDGRPSNPGYFTERTTGIATDLHQVTSDKSQVQSEEWYTIDGRKLNGMPAKKGVYIHNGKKVAYP